jgi:hypothetical protein
VQALKTPAPAQCFRLEGEGSAGPLDLFAGLTVDGAAKDGSYQTHVLPALSLAVSKKAVKKHGEVTGTQLTVRVADAGDAVAGATVRGLPGSPSFDSPATRHLGRAISLAGPRLRRDRRRRPMVAPRPDRSSRSTRVACPR